MRPLAEPLPTYEDLLALPSHQVGEIVNDVLRLDGLTFRLIATFARRR